MLVLTSRREVRTPLPITPHSPQTAAAPETSSEAKKTICSPHLVRRRLIFTTLFFFYSRKDPQITTSPYPHSTPPISTPSLAQNRLVTGNITFILIILSIIIFFSLSLSILLTQPDYVILGSSLPPGGIIPHFILQYIHVSSCISKVPRSHTG